MRKSMTFSICNEFKKIAVASDSSVFALNPEPEFTMLIFAIYSPLSSLSIEMLESHGEKCCHNFFFLQSNLNRGNYARRRAISRYQSSSKHLPIVLGYKCSVS